MVSNPYEKVWWIRMRTLVGRAGTFEHGMKLRITGRKSRKQTKFKNKKAREFGTEGKKAKFQDTRVTEPMNYVRGWGAAGDRRKSQKGVAEEESRNSGWPALCFFGPERNAN